MKISDQSAVFPPFFMGTVTAFVSAPLFLCNVLSLVRLFYSTREKMCNKNSDAVMQ